MSFENNTTTIEADKQTEASSKQQGSGDVDGRATVTTGDVFSGGKNDQATGGADQVGNETGLNGDTPEAGDVDPGSTQSSEETGQDGDPTERKKSMGHPWNG